MQNIHPSAFAIKLNNAAVNGTCPVCGGRNDPRIPLEVFPIDSWEPLCNRCAHSEAAAMARMLDAWYLLGGDIVAMHHSDPVPEGCPF